uniref:Uncharacterized protein n=1 Tax=Anguilla anguilla TaxID=7936 RepID=A0A0E9VX62_ANGAN
MSVGCFKIKTPPLEVSCLLLCV